MMFSAQQFVKAASDSVYASGQTMAQQGYRSTPTSLGVIPRYGLAVLSVTIALGVALVLGRFGIEHTPFLMAIAVTVWYAGTGPGFAAVVLSILNLDYFFIPPLHHIELSLAHAPRFIIFSLVALVVGSVSASRRRNEQELRQARGELEKKVAERTSELRQTTEEAVGAQQRFRDLVDSVEGIVWEADASNFQFLFVSQQAERTLGYPAERWSSEATFWKDHLHEDDREWAVNFRVKATREKRYHDFEYRMLAADGKVVWIRDLVTVVLDADRVTRLRGVMLDVTKRKFAEAALRERASLLDLTHDTIFVRDMQDAITYWNRGAEELYGWKAEQALGKVTHQLMQTAFPAPLEQIRAELLSAGRWEGELVHTKADGTLVVVASRWSLQRDENDRPLAILETNNDITERKRAEEEMRRQANLLEQTHDAILVWSLPGTITYWNRGAEQLYGFSREEAIGRISHDLLRTEHPMAIRLFEPLIERYGSWTGELTHTRRDGRKIVVESRHVLMRDAEGHPLVLETNRDVSERKRAEYLTGQVFESSPDGIAIIATDYTYQRVNAVYERIWGIPAEKMVGMHLLEVLGMETFEQKAKPNLERCFAGEENVGYADWFVTAIGRRYIAVSYSPLRPESDQVAAALVILRDLTEHMLASEGLRQAQAELAHVNRVTTMGELTASLAHEVNQPIAAAVTNANTCLRWLANPTPNVEEARQAVMRIVKDATRAADIISRIRLLFKKGALQQELVDVNELIRDMVVLLRTEVTRYGISLRFELAENLPMVMTDRVQLQQVFMNLMLNGIEAMKDKSDSTNQLTIRSERREDGQLLISISDTGRGLPAQADQIFNAFFTTKPQGTGMGLSISRSIIESQGGRLWAANNSGPGAIFHFTLPTKVEANQ